MSDSRGFLTLMRGLKAFRTGDPYSSPALAGLYDRVVSGATHASSGTFILSAVEAALPNGGRVLEVGAGTGRDALVLARRRADLEVVASEPGAAMLDQARQVDEQPANVSWVQASSDALPFGSEHFDVVYSANAIKHFEQPRASIAEMLRVLRPGGQLLVVEMSPWVPLRSTWTVIRQLRLPLPLKPLIALRLRGETRKLLPPRDEVEGWFSGHAEAEDFAGLDHLAQEMGVPEAFWVARLRRRT